MTPVEGVIFAPKVDEQWIVGQKYRSGPSTIPPPVGSKVKIIRRVFGIPVRNHNRYIDKVGVVMHDSDVPSQASLRDKGRQSFAVNFSDLDNPHMPLVWHREHVYELVSLPEGNIGTATITTTTQEGSKMEYIAQAVRMKEGWIAQVKAYGSGIDKIVWEGVDHYVDLEKDGQVIKGGQQLAVEAAKAQIEEVIEDIFNA